MTLRSNLLAICVSVIISLLHPVQGGFEVVDIGATADHLTQLSDSDEHAYSEYSGDEDDKDDKHDSHEDEDDKDDKHDSHKDDKHDSHGDEDDHGDKEDHAGHNHQAKHKDKATTTTKKETTKATTTTHKDDKHDSHGDEDDHGDKEDHAGHNHQAKHKDKATTTTKKTTHAAAATTTQQLRGTTEAAAAVEEENCGLCIFDGPDPLLKAAPPPKSKLNQTTFWDRACLRVNYKRLQMPVGAKLFGDIHGIVVLIAIGSGLVVGFVFARQAWMTKEEGHLPAARAIALGVLSFVAGACGMFVLALVPARLNCNLRVEELCSADTAVEADQWDRRLFFPAVFAAIFLTGLVMFITLGRLAIEAREENIPISETYNTCSLDMLGIAHGVLQFGPLAAVLNGDICQATGMRYEWYMLEAIVLSLAAPRLALLNHDEELSTRRVPLIGTCHGPFSQAAYLVWLFGVTLLESGDFFLDITNAGLALVTGYQHGKAMFNVVIVSWILQNLSVYATTWSFELFADALIGVGPEPVLKAEVEDDETRKYYITTLALTRLFTENIPLIFFALNFAQWQDSMHHLKRNVILSYLSMASSILAALRGAHTAIFYQTKPEKRRTASMPALKNERPMAAVKNERPISAMSEQAPLMEETEATEQKDRMKSTNNAEETAATEQAMRKQAMRKQAPLNDKSTNNAEETAATEQKE